MEGSGSLTQAQKDELMDQVKQQIAIANAQELLTVRIHWPILNQEHSVGTESVLKKKTQNADSYAQIFLLYPFVF